MLTFAQRRDVAATATGVFPHPMQTPANILAQRSESLCHSQRIESIDHYLVMGIIGTPT